MTYKFQISVKVGYRMKSFTVEHIPIDDRKEHFRLIGRNKVILLESNRPLFRNKGIKKRKPDWKVIDGKVDFQASLIPFYEAILSKLEDNPTII